MIATIIFSFMYELFPKDQHLQKDSFYTEKNFPQVIENT